MHWHGLIDQPWESSAVTLAKKYKVPVVPLRIQARNSGMYYLFSRLNNELRDITLFREMLNKKHRLFRLTFGDRIDPENLPDNGDEATDKLRDIVLNL